MNNNIKNEISMKYVNFNPKIHDANKIAELRYNVDFRTYDKLFSSKQKAVEALEKTLKKDSFIRVVYDGDDIIGILGAYSYDSQPKTHLTPFKLLIVDVWDHFVIGQRVTEQKSLRTLSHMLKKRVIKGLFWMRISQTRRQGHYMKDWDLRFMAKNHS